MTDQEGSAMPAINIVTTDVTDIDAAWQVVEAYLATHGIHKPADDDDPNFWRQVDALQGRDPKFASLMAKLAMAVVRSTAGGRDLLGQAARAKLKAI
jgi:hypothetical protein